MPRKKIYIFYIAGFFLLSIAVVISLIFSGFCFSESRYVTDDEVIEIAVKDVIKTHDLLNKKHFKKVDGQYVEVEGRYANKIVSYKDVDEFHRVNVDCCDIRSHTEKNNYTAGLSTRLVGNFRSFVKVNYLIRYYDENGNVLSKPSSTYVAVTNCGKPWSGF